MSFDRIYQIVPVVGTGPIVLTADPAPGGYRPFIKAMQQNQIADICIRDLVTFEFEVCSMVFTAGGVGGLVTRTGTLTSSNFNEPVNFRGNACDVFVTASATGDPTVASLVAYIASLPTSPPLGGGPWLNGGVVCCDAIAELGNVPTPTAALLAAFLTGLPTARPAGGGMWLNGGVVCFT